MLLRSVPGALVLTAVLTGVVGAANRFEIADTQVILGSTGNVIPVEMDSDQAILGFSVYFEFDDNDVSIQEIRLGADVSPLDPEWEGGDIDPGGEVSYAVVFDFSGPDLTKQLPAGDDIHILDLVLDVERATAGSDTLNLMNVNNSEPRRLNVMTDDQGESVTPTLLDGTITIVDLTPVITGFTNNEGDAGTVFDIQGDNLDENGTEVTVCNQVVAHTVLANGNLRVTAPECGGEGGPTEVEVCTDFGCDSDADGFTYPEVPDAPIIDDIQLGSGPAGTTFFIVGRNFDVPGGFTVEVCGLEVGGTLAGSTQISVVSPPCGEQGAVRVEVCTDFGCDFRPDGYTYPSEPEGNRFLRGNTNNDAGIDLSDGVAVLNFLFLGAAGPECMDAADSNDSGAVDLADAVYTFNFLFLGGDPIPAPNTCGLDPTDDDVADCATQQNTCN
ncbi:MAG: IPT/TIG domain-containing protein [Planctomycetota bacterium]